MAKETNITTLAATGCLMVAEAFRQAAPDVMAAYPITPQTAIVEAYAKYVADGRVHTEYINVESEHSSMSACIGASAAGARVATATSSQGLALMYEELHIASGMRLPIVMANANRAISAPINIHGDHSDVMGARDSGWIILFAETAQEAYDNTVMSFRIAEHLDVLLPVMTTLDGFITTHAMERAELLDDDTVAKFIGHRQARLPMLPLDQNFKPVSHGMFASLGNTYFELKNYQRQVIDASAPIIQQIGDEWSQICGRPYSPIETFETADADYIIVVIGSAAGNVRSVVKELRESGVKVGALRIRTYRPFPTADIVKALSAAKVVGVLDRSDSFGAQCGPLAQDVKSALYDLAQDNKSGLPIVKDYIYGLGGADVTAESIRECIDDLIALDKGLSNIQTVYLGERK